ncbi:MAG: SIS domain-containing protein, partial [Actinomycetota bacterium]
MIAGRGTSDNAARYAQYLWGARNRLSVALAAPSLFTASSSPPSLEGAVVIAISQSGRSPDLIAVVEGARAQRRPTIGITNDPASPLASVADLVLELRVGPERAVAATKTYTAELAAVAMLSAALAENDAMWSALDRAPSLVARSLDASARASSRSRLGTSRPRGLHIDVPPGVEAWLAPIVAIVCAQQFTAHLCLAK